MVAPMLATAGGDGRDRLFAVVLVSGWAGIIHLSVAGEHLAAWWGYGTFFFGVGVAQVASGVVLWRHARAWLVTATAAGNACIILVYVASRTVGVPVGPAHAGHRFEPAGPVDLAATAAEVIVVTALLPLLPPRTRHLVVDLLLAAGIGLWLLRASGRLG